MHQLSVAAVERAGWACNRYPTMRERLWGAEAGLSVEYPRAEGDETLQHLIGCVLAFTGAAFNRSNHRQTLVRGIVNDMPAWQAAAVQLQACYPEIAAIGKPLLTDIGQVGRPAAALAKMHALLQSRRQRGNAGFTRLGGGRSCRVSTAGGRWQQLSLDVALIPLLLFTCAGGEHSSSSSQPSHPTYEKPIPERTQELPSGSPNRDLGNDSGGINWSDPETQKILERLRQARESQRGKKQKLPMTRPLRAATLPVFLRTPAS